MDPIRFIRSKTCLALPLAADLAAYIKAALAAQLGIEVSFCGTKADGSAF